MRPDQIHPPCSATGTDNRGAPPPPNQSQLSTPLRPVVQPTREQRVPTWGAGEERGAGAVDGLEAVPEAREAEPRLVELGALAVDRIQRGERRNELRLPADDAPRRQLRHGLRGGGGGRRRRPRAAALSSLSVLYGVTRTIDCDLKLSSSFVFIRDIPLTVPLRAHRSVPRVRAFSNRTVKRRSRSSGRRGRWPCGTWAG